MMKANKIIFLIAVIILIFSAGCADNDDSKLGEYNKCVSVCASVLSEDFVTLELCRQECKEKFLDENN